MSRFFATTYEYDSDTSSSESDLLSSSEEELISSSGEENQSDDSFFNDDDESEVSDSDFDSDDSDSKPYGPDWFKKSEFRKGGAGSGGNKFLKGANYSDSEGSESDDEGKKVVKSAKDKLLDEMQTVFDKIETAEMSDDWISILNEFDNVTRLLVRAQQQNWGTPNIFIKVVAQVEDLVNSTTQTDIKKKDVSRAYNTTKQRVRKVAKENEDAMIKFRENPDAFDKEPTVDLESSEPAMDINAQFAANKSVNLSSLAAASSEVSFFTSLRIVIDSRGKKNVNPQEMIKIIEDLLASNASPYEYIMAYLTLIPIRMEAASNLSYQPIDQWKAAYNDYMALLKLLEDNIATYRVSELAAFNEDIEKEPVADAQGIKNILGSLFAYVERLDDEFTKSLLNLDPHSSEYLIRLKDEQLIYNMILKTQLYLEQTLPADKKETMLARIFVKRLDHIYYKSDKLNVIIETNAWKSVSPALKSEYIPIPATIDDKYIATLVNSLCDILIKQEDSFLRTRAILYCVFFTASNGDFLAAKDMLLSSKVQSNISKSNSSLQILFNRVVVQLGISAFQACLIEECHQVLNELLASAHLKEILGQQPLQRINSNTENREEQCIPYHQHINLDLIDVVFMTCSLLIEIPQMTAFYSGIRIKRLPYSQKSIRRVLEHHDKASFQGPPETSRDFVVYAAKAMQKGDWESSVSYLQSVKSWNMLPNNDVVMENLVERIKTESMKSYLYTYKKFYSKFSVKQLADVFSLDSAKVVEILETITTEFEINFKLNDEKTTLVVEGGDEITKLEEVALRLNKEYKITKERLFPSRRR